MLNAVSLEHINIIILDKATAFVGSVEGIYLVGSLHFKLLEFKFLNHSCKSLIG